MLKLAVIGNLGADAEIKNFNGETFCSFRVAHTSKYTDRQTGQVIETTQWVSVTINRDTTNLVPFLAKGTKVWPPPTLRACQTPPALSHQRRNHTR